MLCWKATGGKHLRIVQVLAEQFATTAAGSRPGSPITTLKPDARSKPFLIGSKLVSALWTVRPMPKRSHFTQGALLRTLP